MKKKKPAQSETPPAVEKPEINASLIGILGWNSPRFAASHESFLDSLKKAIAIQGGSPLFFGLTGGYEPLDLLHYADGKDRVSTGSRTDANHYPLPARDMVADQVELITQEENLKGLVMIPWSVPSLVGQLMAAIRCGIPTIFLPHYLTWQAEELAGESGKKEADSVPYSQCSLLLSLEVLGLTKIGSLEKIFSVEPDPLAGNAQALEFAEWGGQRIVEFVKQKVSPRRYFSASSFHNCVAVDLALGGSAETYMHLPAIAKEAGVSFPLSLVNEIARKAPQLVPMDKRGEFSMQEFVKWGGLISLLGALSNVLQASPTVMGKNIVEVSKGTTSLKSAFKLNHPHKISGGMRVLFGSLARDGAIFRTAGLKDSWLSYSGFVRVFSSEQDCVSAILSRKIKKGDILVLRYCGPKGSVGMPVLTQLGRALAEKGFQDSVVVLTDGRVRLEGKTPAIVQVAPEAAVGGTLAILEDGDGISWDFSQGVITLRLTESEIRVRLSRWKEQTSNLKSGFLSRYLKYASSTALGATLS